MIPSLTSAFGRAALGVGCKALLGILQVQHHHSFKDLVHGTALQGAVDFPPLGRYQPRRMLSTDSWNFRAAPISSW